MSSGELERIVKLDRLPVEPVTVEAGETERAALAKRFGLPSIETLTAKMTLIREGDAIGATGRLSASFTQNCAIADEPFANTLDEPLALRFVPAGDAPDDDAEMEFDPEAPDEIEYDGAAIDLGEAVAQSLGLLIDPFATGPDAERVRKEAGIVDEDAPSGPLAAALAALKASLNS